MNCFLCWLVISLGWLLFVKLIGPKLNTRKTVLTNTKKQNIALSLGFWYNTN